jgi:hypothetical protein
MMSTTDDILDGLREPLWHSPADNEELKERARSWRKEYIERLLPSLLAKIDKLQAELDKAKELIEQLQAETGQATSGMIIQEGSLMAVLEAQRREREAEKQAEERVE